MSYSLLTARHIHTHIHTLRGSCSSGGLGFCILLKDSLTCSWGELGIEPATFQPLDKTHHSPPAELSGAAAWFNATTYLVLTPVEFQAFILFLNSFWYQEVLTLYCCVVFLHTSPLKYKEYTWNFTYFYESNNQLVDLWTADLTGYRNVRYL